VGIWIARLPASALAWLALLAAPAAAASWEAGLSALEEGRVEKAASIFKRIAPQGDVRAQFALGVMYLEGRGVARDPERAAGWIQRSARAGFLPSQTVLGRMYLLGLGLPEDAGEALKWYRAAAAYGDVNAQGALGLIYDQGWAGLPANPVVAAQWLALAEKGGSRVATKHLERVRARLSPEQLGAVERHVAAWKPKRAPKDWAGSREDAARKLGETLGLDSVDLLRSLH